MEENERGRTHSQRRLLIVGGAGGEATKLGSRNLALTVSRSVRWNPGRSHGRSGRSRNGAIHPLPPRPDTGIDSSPRSCRTASLQLACRGKRRCRLSVSSRTNLPRFAELVRHGPGQRQARGKWRARCFMHLRVSLKNARQAPTRQYRSRSATLDLGRLGGSSSSSSPPEASASPLSSSILGATDGRRSWPGASEI
jgi:hypothetical protein